MELNVAQAQKMAGESFSFEWEEAVGPFRYNGRTLALSAPLRLQGTYTFDGKGFFVEAKAQTVLRQRCARCGETFEQPYAFPVNERFSKASEPSKDDMYPHMGDRLELTQAVMDNFYLHLPLAGVCRPECRGLCPVCGVNRNLHACQCQPNQASGPFAALAALTHEEE